MKKDFWKWHTKKEQLEKIKARPYFMNEKCGGVPSEQILDMSKMEAVNYSLALLSHFQNST